MARAAAHTAVGAAGPQVPGPPSNRDLFQRSLKQAQQCYLERVVPSGHMQFELVAIGLRMLKQAPVLVRAGWPDSPYSTADLIERQAARRGDHPFCLYQDRVISYAEYNAAANRIAHWGLEIGLKRGDVVALLMLNRPEYLETWAGLAKLGVTTALINTNLSGRALAHALTAAGTNRVIVGSECLDSLSTLGDAHDLQVVVAREPGEVGGSLALPPGTTDLVQAVAHLPTRNPHHSVRRGLKANDDLFYIYTSGTTGLPKAARLSHLKFVGIGAMAALVGFGESHTNYNALPLYHSAGGAGAVGIVLGAGGTLALRRKFSATQFWDDVRRYEATAFPYIGEFCRYLLNVPPSDLDGQHKLKFAYGNGLRPDIWEEFRDRFRIPRIIEFYGATEGNVGIINLDGKVGSIGKLPSRLLSDARLVRYDVATDEYERDADGFCLECKSGEVGELIGAMPRQSDGMKGRFDGYTSPEATEKKVLRDAFQTGDAWFRSGDLLRFDAEGYFYFVDRIGDTFRWKGENVSTQDVAESLGAFQGIEMVNVYGVEVRGQDGRAGMAGISLTDPASFDPRAFYRHVQESLPTYAAPVFLRILAEAEVTGTFKLRKPDLQREGFDPAGISEPLYVRDDAKTSYVQLTPELHRAVLSGSMRV